MTTTISDRAQDLSAYQELDRYIRRADVRGEVQSWVSKWVAQMVETTSPLRAPMRIGLCGYAGSGKDTVGALLMMYGVTQLSFANPLRHELSLLLRRANWHQELPGREAMCFHAVRGRKESPWTKPTSPDMRALLQYLGSLRRKEDPDYWLKCMSGTWSKCSSGWVVTDVRYANEARAIRQQGGKLWRVERPGIGPYNDHESEHQPLIADYTIHNHGLLPDLAEAVKMTIKHCYAPDVVV